MDVETFPQVQQEYRVYITPHAQERFVERLGYTPPNVIGTLYAMYKSSVLFGGQYGSDDFIVLATHTSSGLQFCLTCRLAEYRGEKEVMINTVLTKDMAVANMQSNQGSSYKNRSRFRRNNRRTKDKGEHRYIKEERREREKRK